MGSIVYEQRNKIVELENKVENRQIRTRHIGAISIAVVAGMAILIRTELFMSLNGFNRATLLIGTALIMAGIYMTSKENHNRMTVRTLFLTGAAFFLTSVFAMID